MAATALVLVTTTNDVPGFRIHTVIGPILGVAARTTSGYVEGFNSTYDGHSVRLRERMDILARFRMDAVDHLIEQASAIGANAVVAMRFDHRVVTSTWCEICAYGTAVWIVPAPDGHVPLQDTVMHANTS